MIARGSKTDPVLVTTFLIAGAGFFLFIAYLYLLFGNAWPNPQKMAMSGYGVLPEAKQIDDLFGPAWHSVVNYTEPNIVEWQTHALFAGRYELIMRVPMEIDRRSGEVLRVIGEPTFALLELGEVTVDRDGGVGYSVQEGHEFGAAEWKKVVVSKGDFSVIGIRLDRNDPLPNFDRLMAYPKNGIRMSVASPQDVPPTTPAR